MSNSLIDTAPDFSQPIAVLKHCHDRIRKQLATLLNLLAHLPKRGADEQARYLKLAINSILAANSALVAEALALGEAGGLGRADMLEVMTQSAIATPLLGYKKDMLVKGDYKPAFSISQIIKDLDLVLGAARANHVPVPVNAIVRQRFEQAYADGLGEADFFALAGAGKADDMLGNGERCGEARAFDAE
eukprot:gene3746-5115_t